MTEKYTLIIIGIVAIVGVISLLNVNVTGRFTETYYESYCSPAACKDACGKICATYTLDTPFKTSKGIECISSYDIVNGKKQYKAWSCD